MTEREDELDRALATLPRRDLPPMEARAVLVSAEAQLRSKARITGWMRAEPLTMAALAFAHLCWALARVYLLR